MSRKKKNELALTREALPSGEQAALEIKRALRDQIAEILAEESAELEPFFRSHEVSYAIKRTQTVHEQNGLRYVFEDWGCLVCKRKDVAHGSLGMCRTCYMRIAQRREHSIRRRVEADGEITFHDTAELARAALLPSIEKLIRKGREK